MSTNTQRMHGPNRRDAKAARAERSLLILIAAALLVTAAVVLGLSVMSGAGEGLSTVAAHPNLMPVR